MPANQAACLLKRTEEAQRLSALVAAQDLLRVDQEAQIGSLFKLSDEMKQLARMEAQRADAQKENAQKLSDRVDNLQDQLGAWYRTPLLWTAVGVVGTVAIVLAFGAGKTVPTINVTQ